MSRFLCPSDWSLEQRLDFGTGPRDPETGCEPWTRGVTSEGYGKFRVKSKDYYATRVALEIKLCRKLAKGEEAKHTCGNRRCVSQDHLVPGLKKKRA